MRGVREIFYQSSNNAIDVQCLSYDPASLGEISTVEPQDLSLVTRFTFTLAGVTIDSDVTPASITWLGQNAVGKVTILLGGHGVPVGEHYARLVSFDPLNPFIGIVWTDRAGLTPLIVQVEP